jgi:L-ascorbate metabolism protein UlaG (beta-lactamase superfamily)
VNSPETQEKLEKAEAPFDDIDLILTTHGHRDHFSAGPVMKHLAADPGSVFIGPPQAVEELDEKKSEEKYKDRIEEVDLEMFASSEFEFDGIRIEAHRIHHSQYMDKDEETGEEINRHRDVENLAYLIEIEGVRLLHVGDAVLPLNREYLESDRFPKGKIDIVFLEFFDWSEETKEILEPMRPDQIVFMHLPPQPEEIEKYARHLKKKFPNAVLFQEPLQTRGF